MTIQTDTPRPVHDLSDDLLERCHRRAASYDRENRFFQEDFDELRDAGYLRAALPLEFGGGGASAVDLVGAQRRLGAVAPPTALALAMHHYFVGGAAQLHAAGDPSVRFILDDVAQGEVYAAGHAEVGNDLPILLSTTGAERVDGGYRINGHKRFGSLGPVWTRLGIHALDATDPDGPKVIHAVVPRDSDGVHVGDRWDSLGMRASQSFDTVLDDVFVPDDRVVRALPAGDPTDPWFGSMSTWAFLLIGAVYTGIADRAFQIAIDEATTKTSIAIPRGTMAHNPEIQHAVAEMHTALLSAGTLLDSTARDWTDGVDPVTWPPRILALKPFLTDNARRVVERAQEVAGGKSLMRGDELERLYRDVRCGWYNGINAFMSSEMVGKMLLGVDPAPRW